MVAPPIEVIILLVSIIIVVKSALKASALRPTLFERIDRKPSRRI